MDEASGAAAHWRAAADIYDELGDDQAEELRTRARNLERGQADDH